MSEIMLPTHPGQASAVKGVYTSVMSRYIADKVELSYTFKV
jgi:hypothetical protein